MATSRRSVKASGIIETVGLANIGVLAAVDRPGVAAAVLDAVGARGIAVPFIVELADHEGRSNIVFCVPEERLQESVEAASEVVEQVEAKQIRSRTGVTLVAVYGPHFKDRPGSAAQAFLAIADAGVNILAISTSVSSISCVVDQSETDKVISALQAAFQVPDSGVLISGDGVSRPAKR